MVSGPGAAPVLHKPSSVGVVIPCKDEIGAIERCLRALRAQEPRVACIVVVDNGSTDGSLEIAKEWADQVIEVPVGSVAALRNAGAAALGEVDVIGFVDADTEVRPGWLAAGLRALDQGADLVGSRTEAGEDDAWVARQWAYLEARQAHGASKLWSQHLLIRRSTFRALGGFDTGRTTLEDADLSVRVEAAGGRVTLDPDMRAVHHGFPQDLRSFVRRERWHTGAGEYWSLLSRGSRVLVATGTVWTVLGAVTGVRAAATGDTRRLGAWASATVAAVPALGFVGSRRASTALGDGVLLGIWVAVRVLHLPREILRSTRDRRR